MPPSVVQRRNQSVSKILRLQQPDLIYYGLKWAVTQQSDSNPIAKMADG